MMILNVGKMFISMFFLPLETFFEFASQWFSYYSFFLKVLTFMYHEDTMLLLESSLKSSVLSKISKNDRKIYEPDIKFAMRFGNFGRGALIAFMIYFCLYKPFAEYPKLRVPYRHLLPCNDEKIECFVPLFLIESSHGLGSAIVNNALDCLFVKLTAVSSSIFKVLQNKLETLNTSNNLLTEEEMRQNVELHMEILR